MTSRHKAMLNRFEASCSWFSHPNCPNRVQGGNVCWLNRCCSLRSCVDARHAWQGSLLLAHQVSRSRAVVGTSVCTGDVQSKCGKNRMQHDQHLGLLLEYPLTSICYLSHAASEGFHVCSPWLLALADLTHLASAQKYAACKHRWSCSAARGRCSSANGGVWAVREFFFHFPSGS